MILSVLLSFVIFRSETLAQAGAEIGALFGAGGLPLVSKEALVRHAELHRSPPCGSGGRHALWPCRLGQALSRRLPPMVWSILRALALSALLLLCTACLVDGSFNPFLYFRF